MCGLFFEQDLAVNPKRSNKEFIGKKFQIIAAICSIITGSQRSVEI